MTKRAAALRASHHFRVSAHAAKRPPDQPDWQPIFFEQFDELQFLEHLDVHTATTLKRLQLLREERDAGTIADAYEPGGVSGGGRQ